MMWGDSLEIAIEHNLQIIGMNVSDLFFMYWYVQRVQGELSEHYSQATMDLPEQSWLLWSLEQ